ncbi:MAG: adenine/guanine/hypoxanthine permease [Acidobacteriota bacterium]|nr:adenine/guanine/hypoxanthine permease [Acidobacteriota bacterium]
MTNLIKKLFGEKTSFSIEFLAGFTTFLTMAYIILANADILSVTGMDKTALIAVTCLVSGIVTIVSGIYTNSPIALAPGMGLNAYFAFTLVLNQGISWPVALGIVFVSGFIFLLVTICGLRKMIIAAIPKELLSAITVGIGIFIAFMGLQNIGLVIDDPATLVKAAPITKTILIGLAGLLLMILLELKRIKGSLLIGIFFATLLSIVLGEVELPDKVFSLETNVSQIFGKIDIIGALKISFLAPIFSMLFIDLFDTIGSLLGLSQQIETADKGGELPHMDRLYIIDASASMFGAVCGTSTTTTYVESASGIASGGRTGLTSIVTGLLFLLATLFIPVFAIVPKYATAPALLMVGFFMMSNIQRIDFSDLEIGFPSFIIILMIALSYSISTGLAFGFLSYSLVKIFRGKISEIKPALWVINLLCILFFVV